MKKIFQFSSPFHLPIMLSYLALICILSYNYLLFMSYYFILHYALFQTVITVFLKVPKFLLVSGCPLHHEAVLNFQI